ncbi:MAG: TolB protein, partial [Thermoleophilaceae bacterium]|nr:TolB protein [Thermoleophilaceae bacterium]
MLTPLAIAAGAVPAQATYPGAAGLLAYDTCAGHRDGSSSICVRSPLGGAQRELMADRPFPYGERPSDVLPSWSRDGRRFVFTRRLGTGPRVFVARADGSHAREIPLPEDMWAEDAVLGPDGRTIAFDDVAKPPPDDYLGSGPTTVRLARLDGSHIRSLGLGGGPAWTPDGHVLWNDETKRCGALTIARPDGSGRRVVDSGHHGKSCQAANDVDVAPDGRHVTFTGPGGVWTMRLDGKNRRRVPGTRGAFSCTWSPTGHSIAYYRYPRAHHPNFPGGIYLTNPAGAKIRLLKGGGPHVG